MLEVGRVVTVYGRSLLRFAAFEDKVHTLLKPGAYVKVECGGSWAYAMIVSFNLLDELYRKGRIVEELEGYTDLRPARNELIAMLLGVDTGDGIRRGVPELPRPGQKVFLVERDDLSRIAGSGDLEIGRLSFDGSVPFTLSLNMLCSRHFAVLAMTGAGKSNTVAVILSSLLENYSYPRIIVIDTHNEYVPLAARFKTARVSSPAGRTARLVETRYGIAPTPLEVPLWTLGLEEIAGLLKLDPSRATKQLLYLRNALQEVRRRRYSAAGADDVVYFEAEELKEAVESQARPGRYTDRSLDDLILKIDSLLENADVKYVTKPVASSKLYESLDLREPQRSVETYVKVYEQLLQPGLTIVALGGLPSDAQASTAATILKSLWRLITASVLAGNPQPTLLIVEEAHNYAPQGRWGPARDILERIAKEGRKFGIGIGVVSQRPRELSQTLLAQCGTLIALRTANPRDQEYILSSMEDVVSEMVEGLSGLTTGEALISGSAAPIPAIAKVHDFQAKSGITLGGKDIDWRGEWSRQPRAVNLTPYLIGEISEEISEKEKEESTIEKYFM
ncbi:MAG: ATP-binding protein [Thermofilaceae archaeon]|nr:ATP-binding protein [Thermofilaceae archaeon]MCX8180894.1 ATP-binding protein [Thermofilaceae archaeon]MDW8003459.1 ATP-binding protein [Thermofilaceae archaeon]